MSKNQLRLLAAACWLVTIACGIAFLGMWDEYAALRDGDRVTAKVDRVEPHRTYVAAHLAYVDRGQPREMTSYPSIEDAAAFAVGSPVELLVSSSGTIRASQLAGKRPSILLAIGAAVALILGIFAWLAPRKAAARRAARRDPLDVVIDSVARTRNITLAGGIILVVSAPMFALVAYVDHDDPTVERALVVGLAGLAAVAAVLVLRRAYQLRDPRKNDLVELIERRPADIAWYYIRETRGRGGIKVLDAMLWKTDGKSAMLRLVREDVDPLLAEIARRAPHAARGFDHETERMYREQPTRWRP